MYRPPAGQALAHPTGWSRERLLSHQSRALAELRAHASARSRFYRRLRAGLEDAPLEALPVVTKAQLMEHFDEAVTDRRIRKTDVEAHLRSIAGDELFLGRLSGADIPLAACGSHLVG